MSSGNISKYEFLTVVDILPEKKLLEKAATIKVFECSALGSELKKQTSVVRKQYLELDKVCEFDKKGGNGETISK